MSEFTTGIRGGFSTAEASFSVRAIAILIEAGVLRRADYGENAAKKLHELLDELEAANPMPKQPNEAADIARVRDAIEGSMGKRR